MDISIAKSSFNCTSFKSFTFKVVPELSITTSSANRYQIRLDALSIKMAIDYISFYCVFLVFY